MIVMYVLYSAAELFLPAIGGFHISILQLVPQFEDQLEYLSFPLGSIVRDHKYGNAPSLDPLPALTWTSSDKLYWWLLSALEPLLNAIC